MSNLKYALFFDIYFRYKYIALEAINYKESQGAVLPDDTAKLRDRMTRFVDLFEDESLSIDRAIEFFEAEEQLPLGELTTNPSLRDLARDNNTRLHVLKKNLAFFSEAPSPAERSTGGQPQQLDREQTEQLHGLLLQNIKTAIGEFAPKDGAYYFDTKGAYLRYSSTHQVSSQLGVAGDTIIEVTRKSKQRKTSLSVELTKRFSEEPAKTGTLDGDLLSEQTLHLNPEEDYIVNEVAQSQVFDRLRDSADLRAALVPAVSFERLIKSFRGQHAVVRCSRFRHRSAAVFWYQPSTSSAQDPPQAQAHFDLLISAHGKPRNSFDLQAATSLPQQPTPFIMQQLLWIRYYAKDRLLVHSFERQADLRSPLATFKIYSWSPAAVKLAAVIRIPQQQQASKADCLYTALQLRKATAILEIDSSLETYGLLQVTSNHRVVRVASNKRFCFPVTGAVIASQLCITTDNKKKRLAVLLADEDVDRAKWKLHLCRLKVQL